MKILVTGGAGYIGSHTIVELIAAGHEVEILDDMSNAKESALDAIQKITGVYPKLHLVNLMDLDKVLAILKDGNFDAVIHFAGLKAVAESVERPLWYYENNLIGTLNLLEAMQTYKVNKIIFSSSATVYGDPGTTAFTEDLPSGQGITNPYGKTKYMIEEILKDVSASNPDFEVTILRYFNPVGAHPSGKLGENPNGRPNNLMPIIMKVAQGEYSELSVYGDDYPTPDGTCIRDYIHVVDLAKGHLAALDHMEKGVRIYNLGSGKGTSVLEMITAFEKASGKKLPYKIVSRRPGDLAEMYAVPTKAEKELGWKTSLTINDAMKDTLKFLENIDTL
ncbi:UDP-glucose 4-epimerase GalE [Candidatus Saccharibacteria bacterium]|nr:UDP-glucose 4-epimerase GalE [Candidatus Saccharibacteria bacterium]